jgi:hydroxypyruvate isomerase
MKLIPCIEWLFKAEHDDFARRLHAAKAAGFEAVEFHLWRDKPVDAIVDAMAETGVRVTSFCADPRASLVDPAEHAVVLGAVRDAIPVARRLGGAGMIVASGFARAGIDDAEQRAAAVHVLREAARLAEEGGATLLLEPVNMVIGGQPMFVRTIRHGLDLVEEVDSPALRLLADVYHSAVSGEQVEEAFGSRLGLVAEIQVADVEGRHEPGTGRLDWPGLIALLRRQGYAGDLGLEYLPTLPTLESLALARRTLGL